MVKKLLVALFFGGLACSVSAQVAPKALMPSTLSGSKAVKELKVNTPFSSFGKGGLHASGNQNVKTFSLGSSKKLSPATRAGEDTGIWWAYPTNPQGEGYVWGWDIFAQAFGMSSWSGGTYYNTAIYVPSTYANAIIDQLEFVAFDAKYTGIKVWFAPYAVDNMGYIVLPDTPEDAAYSQDVPDVDMTGTNDWVHVDLNQGYTIPDNGCFVGVSFTSTAGANPIFAWDVNSSGAFFMQMDYNGEKMWDDFAFYTKTSLTTTLHMDVSNVPPHNISANAIVETTSMVGQQTGILLNISNEAFSDADGFSYVVTVDGEAQPEQEFNATIGAKASGSVNLPYTFDSEGLHSVSVEITKVGGEENRALQPSASGNVITLSEAAERTSVVEQHTGMWCGNCPRGHVGMELFKEMYGGKVVTLAGHISDTLMCEDYLPMIVTFNSQGGAPVAFFDRLSSGDPYLESNAQVPAFGAYKDLDAVRAAFPSEASLSLTADWTDDSKNRINASVEYAFNYDRTSAPYGIAFILSEDGMGGRDIPEGEQMTAEDSVWLQHNYYSGDKNWGNDDNMLPWVSAGDLVQTTYDNVIVAAWDALVGAEGSVMAPITKGETLPYNVTLDISRNTLIQNKDNLSLTALLINQNSGAIVNAAQVPLGPGSSVVGIEDVNAAGSNAAEVARYNVNGVQLSAPQKGLNIVKYSDGTTKKVVVK